MKAGSRERRTVGMAGLLGWRVIKEGAMTQRRRKKEIEIRRCSTALISNFGLITAALYKSSETPLFRQSAESCRCFFGTKSLITITKGADRRVARHKDNQRAYVVSIRHCSRRAAQLLLVPSFRALLCSTHASSGHISPAHRYVWSVYSDKVKKSYDHLFWACRRVTGWVSRLCRIP